MPEFPHSPAPSFTETGVSHTANSFQKSIKSDQHSSQRQDRTFDASGPLTPPLTPAYTLATTGARYSTLHDQFAQTPPPSPNNVRVSSGPVVVPKVDKVPVVSPIITIGRSFSSYVDSLTPL